MRDRLAFSKDLLAFFNSTGCSAFPLRLGVSDLNQIWYKIEYLFILSKVILKVLSFFVQKLPSRPRMARLPNTPSVLYEVTLSHVSANESRFLYDLSLELLTR